MRDGKIKNIPLFGKVKFIMTVIRMPDTAQRVLKGENQLCLIPSLCITGEKKPCLSASSLIMFNKDTQGCFYFHLAISVLL